MSNYRRILKNAVFLYFRMIIVTGVALFTSRYVLNVLGVQDFGVYNLVGGFVTLVSFLNSAMTTATQRYIAFDIGAGNLSNLKKTFSTAMLIHCGIGLTIFILGETVGLWYINNVMVYAQERSVAVNIIYQFLLFTFLINIIQVPYNALITAYERMNVFAMFSLGEAMLKLLAVFLITKIPGDNLVVYGALIFVVAIIVRLSYQVYCRKHFHESRFEFIYDRKYLKELIHYSSWNLIGNLAAILRMQGNNVVLNYFFGVVINAAYGLALQVNSSINSFVTNLQTAFNPQIIKTYANGDTDQCTRLATYASKFSFFIILLVVAPLLYNLDFVITAWLSNVPDFTMEFLRISLLMLLVDSLSGPYMTVITATGKIKAYHLVIGSFMLLCLPLSYIFLKLGYTPTVVFSIMIVMNSVAYLLRLVFVKRLVGLDMVNLFWNKIFRIAIIVFLLLLFCRFINIGFDTAGWIHLILTSSILISFISILILVVGLGKQERKKIFSLIRNK